MSGGVMIALSVIGCVVGFLLNRAYTKKYGEPAIQWKLFIVQVICIIGALSQLPDGEVSFRFLFWAAVALLSFVAGLWLCRQHAKNQQAEPGDTAAAMAAQALLPLGVALVIMMIAGVFVFGFLWAH